MNFFNLFGSTFFTDSVEENFIFLKNQGYEKANEKALIESWMTKGNVVFTNNILVIAIWLAANEKSVYVIIYKIQTNKQIPKHADKKNYTTLAEILVDNKKIEEISYLYEFGDNLSLHDLIKRNANYLEKYYYLVEDYFKN